MLNWVFAALLATSPLTVGADPPIVPPEQVMVLPAELQARLQKEVLAGAPSQQVRLKRLLLMVFDTDGLRLTYEPDVTTSVAQTYATRTTNCMSFTLLFLALARQAGLNAYPQEIPETMAWHQDSGVIYLVDHINPVVRLGDRAYPIDIARDSYISFRTPKRISDQRMLAGFYNNLAMKDLEDNRIAPALVNMDTALKLDPDYASNWSNAGVLYLHNGDHAAAKQAYAKALALEPDNITALENMANLAQFEGDHDSEAKYRERLEHLEHTDPLYQFIRASGYESAGDYVHAIEFYQRAIRLRGDEPRFHAALSRAYALAGDNDDAIKELARAKWRSTGKEHDEYKAQLERMRNVAKTGVSNSKARQ